MKSSIILYLICECVCIFLNSSNACRLAFPVANPNKEGAGWFLKGIWWSKLNFFFR